LWFILNIIFFHFSFFNKRIKNNKIY